MNRHVIELQAVGAAVKAYLNGYLLYESSHACHNFSANIRPWLETENVIRIVLTASSEGVPDTPVTFTVKASLVGEEEELLCKLEFPQGVDKSEDLTLPFDTLGRKFVEGHGVEFQCDSSALMPRIPWSEGNSLNEREIYEFFARIQSLFVRGDTDSIMELSKPRIAFCSELYGIASEEFALEIRKDLESTFASKPEWRTISDPGRQLMVHEFKENRIVRLLDLNGNGALMTRVDEDGVQTGYDLIFCASVDGLVWIM